MDQAVSDSLMLACVCQSSRKGRSIYRQAWDGLFISTKAFGDASIKIDIIRPTLFVCQYITADSDGGHTTCKL